MFGPTTAPLASVTETRTKQAVVVSTGSETEPVVRALLGYDAMVVVFGTAAAVPA